MKLAICSQGETVGSQVDPRFGRSKFFVIVDLETNEVDSIENPSLILGQGAGVNAAQVLAKKEAVAVCVKHVGPKAFSSLGAAGIDIYCMEADKTVKEVVEEFRDGLLRKYTPHEVSGGWD